MTYYGSKELAASFRTVRKNTIQIAQEIPEASYGFRATPDSRPVAATLAHLAVAPRFQRHIHIEKRLTKLEGFDFFGFFGALQAEESKPRTKAELIALLESEGESFATLLEQASEEFLGEIVTQSPGTTPATKSRFEMLLSSKEHEMHHRAQLMVVERLLGITPHFTRRMEEYIASMKAASSGR
jgi:uncharacterized damage-inducible protein DinB